MADREGWTIMEERWTVCPARTKKLLVTISVRGKRYDKAKYKLEAMPFIYRKAVWSCFFSCASAHSPELLLAFTQHRKSPNQSSHPPGLSAASQYPFQWCYSLFLMHMQSSTICSLWPDILHTHSRPQNSEKSPGPHDSLLFRPCHVPGFCVVPATDANPLFHKGSQLPFSLKARWLWHLPISEGFSPT